MNVKRIVAAGVIAVGMVLAPCATAFADEAPAPMNCPEYTVPGWLDEAGNPTSCVGDSPCPGLVPPACLPETVAVDPAPVVVPTVPVAPAMPEKTLAFTGPVDGWLAIPGGAMLTAGVLVLLMERKVARAC